jgi:hypothetical protein
LYAAFVASRRDVLPSTASDAVSVGIPTGSLAATSEWTNYRPERRPHHVDDHHQGRRAAANPLRGVGSEAPYLPSLLPTMDGPFILVGHSYRGIVITAAANSDPSVKVLA